MVWTFVAGTHEAHAANALEGIQDSVTSIFGRWLDNGLTYAAELFAIIGVTGAMVVAGRYYSTVNSWEGVHLPVTDFLFRIIIPYVLLKSASTFLPRIFAFASHLAGGITGVPISGPGGILHEGIIDAVILFKACTVPMATYLKNPVNAVNAITSLAGFAPSIDFFLAIGLTIIGAVAALTVLLAFALIAAELLGATVNILFVTSIGSVQLGWAAAPGTSDMAASYWAGVQTAIFRVIVIYGVASFITTAAKTALGTPDDTSDTYKMCLSALASLAFAWAAVYLAFRVPQLSENAFSGRPVFTGSGLVQHGLSPALTAASAASAGFAAGKAAMAKRAAVATVRRAGD